MPFEWMRMRQGSCWQERNTQHNIFLEEGSLICPPVDKFFFLSQRKKYERVATPWSGTPHSLHFLRCPRSQLGSPFPDQSVQTFSMKHRCFWLAPGCRGLLCKCSELSFWHCVSTGRITNNFFVCIFFFENSDLPKVQIIDPLLGEDIVLFCYLQ